MKFVYVDESGTGDEPIGVMAGVIADSYRMRPTKQNWDNLLKNLSELVERNITEIHTRDFYPGNGVWRNLDGPVRSQIIDIVFNWLVERKHHIVYTVVLKNKYRDNFDGHSFSEDIGTLWRFMAFHLTLSLQKYFQGAKRGKKRKKDTNKNFVLIFDHEHTEQERFTDLILNPPTWSNTYYDKLEKQQQLDKLVDVPHFVDSKHVGLIQLADFITFFLRKFLELNNGFIEPDYDGEFEKLNKWFKIIESRNIPKSNSYASRARCDCADYFYQFAPDEIK